MAIIVDPYLLTLPMENGATQEQIISYALRLREWDTYFGDYPEEYALSGWAMDALYEMNLVPTVANLQELFLKHSVNTYSARDIAPTCQGFLANGRRLEDLLRVREAFGEVDCVAGTEIVIPDQVKTRLPPAVAKCFVQELIYSAYALQKDRNGDAWSIGTAPFSATRPAEVVTEADLCKMTDAAEVVPHVRVSRRWPLLMEPDYIFATWDVQEHCGDPVAATRIVWSRRKARGELPTETTFEKYAISFRPEFTESLRTPSMRKRPEYGKDIERVFDAVVNVVTDLWAYNSDKHHALRKYILVRDSPQQKRRRKGQDGELTPWEPAVRVEVTGGGECLHLHYWRCSDNSYEFSNVTEDHDDATIHTDAIDVRR